VSAGPARPISVATLSPTRLPPAPIPSTEDLRCSIIVQGLIQPHLVYNVLSHCLGQPVEPFLASFPQTVAPSKRIISVRFHSSHIADQIFFNRRRLLDTPDLFRIVVRRDRGSTPSARLSPAGAVGLATARGLLPGAARDGSGSTLTIQCPSSAHSVVRPNSYNSGQDHTKRSNPRQGHLHTIDQYFAKLPPSIQVLSTSNRFSVLDDIPVSDAFPPLPSAVILSSNSSPVCRGASTGLYPSLATVRVNPERVSQPPRVSVTRTETSSSLDPSREVVSNREEVVPTISKIVPVTTASIEHTTPLNVQGTGRLNNLLQGISARITAARPTVGRRIIPDHGAN
jgi:hypothetical protein